MIDRPAFALAQRRCHLLNGKTEGLPLHQRNPRLAVSNGTILCTTQAAPRQSLSQKINNRGLRRKSLRGKSLCRIRRWCENRLVADAAAGLSRSRAPPGTLPASRPTQLLATEAIDEFAASNRAH